MTEEELLARATEERRSIVDKYKRSHQNGVNVGALEDTSVEVYGDLDRYGFKREKDEILTESKQEIQREREREQKWLKMLKQWENTDTNKLKRRIYKGIPNAIRGKIWSKLLGLDAIKEEQRGKYKEMCDLAGKYSPDIRQIDLDVNRTYREHIMFRERYSLKQCELFNVLSAYSVYNLEIGYCQGMSQIVALLLMYLDEEDAFWALSTFVSNSKFHMHGFYIPGFPKLIRYQEHHDKIMIKFLPKLKRHLDKNGVDTGIYTLKWFFQCFLDRIPFKLTLRVWDVFIFEGERILSAMAFNILKLHRKRIQLLGMDDILQFLQLREIDIRHNDEYLECAQYVLCNAIMGDFQYLQVIITTPTSFRDPTRFLCVTYDQLEPRPVIINTLSQLPRILIIPLFRVILSALIVMEMK